jgi:phage-related protein
MAIVVPIVSEWNSKGLDKSVSDIKGAQTGWQKAGAGFESAFVPATAALGALVAGGIALAKGAADDAAAASKLAGTLKRTTGATDDQVASTEDWISAQGEALGVADDDLRPALATLATATGDVTKAQALAATAMDLSAAKGISLEAATNAIAKASTGSTGALKKLVPGLDAATLASGDMTAITAELARVTGGAATDAANTQAGQMARLQLSISETGEAIGGALLPVLDILIPVLAAAAKWASENTTVLLVLAGVVATVAGAIIAVNIAMKAYAAISKIVKAATVAWTAVQWLWNAAMVANPIGLVILAIVALVAAIWLLWTKCDWFRKAVMTVWDAIAKGVKALWGVIQNVFGWIADKIDWLVGKFSGIADTIGGIFGAIGGIFGQSTSMTLHTKSTSGRAAVSTPVVVNVNGALDVEGVARQIRSLLDNHDRRQGRAVLRPVAF